MRWVFASMLLLIAGCTISLDCEAACDQTREDACAAPDMPACDTLCADLRAEAMTADCNDEFSELEGCMGEDPICMGVSRCSDQLGAHRECIDAFCAGNPGACTADP